MYTYKQLALIEKVKGILGKEDEDFFDRCTKIIDVFTILVNEDSTFLFTRPRFVEAVRAKIVEVRESIRKLEEKNDPFQAIRRKEEIMNTFPEMYRKRKEVEVHMNKVMRIIGKYTVRLSSTTRRILYLFEKLEERYPIVKSYA